ncbi:hypothetical protein [Sphingomonas psychrotolerans]|uniref:Uncharacterized protein n=1 Tax=Sphingomonas psychrotolerans TaxID=1327635 RepID=A0A2K8MTT6_9SPHN|nr:hypothetical protein [Sphingomonas psychrotolerans]ATY34921.1 hypothetical protein CVN68_22700 [Sphingomonas psychrotolerans]
MTKTSRPDIPKRLAARIRAAQENVRQKRISIVYSEKNYEQSSARVADFEADPDAFSARYYGRHDRDSYPVVTNISTNRERNARHERRRDERIVELAELEARLMRVEAEVLVEVTRLRPTQGRVPWPRKLLAMKQFRADLDAQLRREDVQWRTERAADDALFEKLMAKEEARAAAESAREGERLPRDIAAMSPAECAAHRAWADYFMTGLKSGELTMSDVLDMLRRQRPPG